MARKKNQELESIRREQIMEAAARVFKAKGFHGARTEDICTETGMSAGTLFRYFKTKMDIISAIIDAEMEACGEELHQIVQPEGMHFLASMSGQDLRELLQPIKYSLTTESWIELSRYPEGKKQLHIHTQTYLGIFSQALRQGQKDGWVKPDLNPTGTANLLLTLLTGLQYDADTGMDIPFDDLAEAVSHMVRTCILVHNSR